MNEYRIAYGDSQKELEENVNKLLLDGWQLQGGVTVAAVCDADYSDSGEIHHTFYVEWWAQAMTRVRHE